MTYNDDFVIVDNLEYKYSNIDDYQLYNNDLKNDKTIIIPFTTNDLVNSIKEFYNTDLDLFKQFNIDMMRTLIYYNNRKINNRKLYNIIKRKNNKKEIMYCLTQAVYYWPYKIIQSIYADYHVGEISVLRNKSNNYIKYYDDKIIIYKKLRVFQINQHSDDETLRIINIKFELMFDSMSLLTIF